MQALEGQLDQANGMISKFELLTHTPRDVLARENQLSPRKDGPSNPEATSAPPADSRPPPCPSCRRRVGHHRTCEHRDDLRTPRGPSASLTRSRNIAMSPGLRR